ncbi:hypothetical protein Hypma_006065, partial [Hypsizygus marmoreus]
MTGFITPWYGVGTLNPSFPEDWRVWVGVGMAQEAHYCPHLSRIPAGLMLPSLDGRISGLPAFVLDDLLVPQEKAECRRLYEAARFRELELAASRACISCFARGWSEYYDTRGPGTPCGPCLSWNRPHCSLLVGDRPLENFLSPQRYATAASQALINSINRVHRALRSLNRVAAEFDISTAMRYAGLAELGQLGDRFHRTGAFLLQ